MKTIKSQIFQYNKKELKGSCYESGNEIFSNAGKKYILTDCQFSSQILRPRQSTLTVYIVFIRNIDLAAQTLNLLSS